MKNTSAVGTTRACRPWLAPVAAATSAEGFRLFADRIGVSKNDSLIDYVLFEDAMREVMNESDQRRVAVLDPVKLIIDNYPAGQFEDCAVTNHPLTSGTWHAHHAVWPRTVDRRRRLPGNA